MDMGPDQVLESSTSWSSLVKVGQDFSDQSNIFGQLVSPVQRGLGSQANLPLLWKFCPGLALYVEHVGLEHAVLVEDALAHVQRGGGGRKGGGQGHRGQLSFLTTANKKQSKQPVVDKKPDLPGYSTLRRRRSWLPWLEEEVEEEER